MISDSPPSPTETALSAGASGEHRGVRFGLSRSSLHSHEWHWPRSPAEMARDNALRWRWRLNLWRSLSSHGNFLIRIRRGTGVFGGACHGRIQRVANLKRFGSRQSAR
jgi:hypothetical protein